MLTQMIDSHLHLTQLNEEFLKNYIEDSRRMGVSKILMMGFDTADWDMQQNLKCQHPHLLLSSVGLHPWAIPNQSAANLSQLFENVSKNANKADFLGETGLDYHIPNGRALAEQQMALFEKHLELAIQFKKPLILHIVKAHEDAVHILAKHIQSGAKLHGIIHHFSGSKEVAQKYLALGFKISIGPGILNSGYQKLKDTCLSLGENDYVFETDSPQSPSDTQPDPQLILKVIQEFAKLRGEPPNKVIQHSTQNFMDLLDVEK